MCINAPGKNLDSDWRKDICGPMYTNLSSRSLPNCISQQESSWPAQDEWPAGRHTGEAVCARARDYRGKEILFTHIKHLILPIWWFIQNRMWTFPFHQTYVPECNVTSCQCQYGLFVLVVWRVFVRRKMLRASSSWEIKQPPKGRL